MNRTERLLSTLRQEMQTRGIKYPDLANKLNLSLPTIKRFFNQGSDVSLERLESMCLAAGLDFYDLVELARREQAETSLSEEQEQLLTDEKMLAIFFSASCNLHRLEIKSYCKYSDQELDEALKALEVHGLIERHPHGRLKSRFVFFSLKWIPNGPFERRYGESFRRAFLQEAFGSESGYSGFRQVYLTRASLDTLAMKMRDLFNDAIAMSNADVKNELTEVLAVGVLLSTHPWIPEIVRNVYRPNKDCASLLRRQLYEPLPDRDSSNH